MLTTLAVLMVAWPSGIMIEMGAGIPAPPSFFAIQILYTLPLMADGPNP